jgi:hypothetical protein
MRSQRLAALGRAPPCAAPLPLPLRPEPLPGTPPAVAHRSWCGAGGVGFRKGLSPRSNEQSPSSPTRQLQGQKRYLDPAGHALSLSFLLSPSPFFLSLAISLSLSPPLLSFRQQIQNILPSRPPSTSSTPGPARTRSLFAASRCPQQPSTNRRLHPHKRRVAYFKFGWGLLGKGNIPRPLEHFTSIHSRLRDMTVAL